MNRRLEHVWFNVSRLFRWHRVLGIGGLCVVAYFLVFYVFGRTDVSGFMPPSYVASFRWPSLPKFLVGQGDTKTPETIYTVPTRQITSQELSQIPSGPVVAGAGAPPKSNHPK